MLFIITSIYFIYKKHNIKLYIMTISLFITIFSISFLKYGLARYRPKLFIEHNLYGFHIFSINNSFHSFPSAHAALAFTGLLSLSSLFNRKNITMILIIISCIISISRILTEEHYLSDIISGSYIGIFSYFWVKSKFANFLIKYP